MKEDNIVLTLAFVALGMSIVASGITYLSVSNLVTQITGFASSGTANLTVESVAQINFTTGTINWGSGRVNSGASSAQLTTFETNNVTNGNWTLQQAGGLRIENIGNINVSLNLSVGKTAAQFLGGTNPGYQWNVTNVESNSCLNSTGGTQNLNLSTFFTASTTTFNFCGRFQFVDSADTIRIDFNLTVPSDSQTGSLGDIITATATAV